MCIWRVRGGGGLDAIVLASSQRSARVAANDCDDADGGRDTDLSLVLPDGCARDGDQTLVLMSCRTGGGWTLLPQLRMTAGDRPAVLADVTSILALIELLEMPVDAEGRIIGRIRFSGGTLSLSQRAPA